MTLHTAMHRTHKYKYLNTLHVRSRFRVAPTFKFCINTHLGCALSLLAQTGMSPFWGIWASSVFYQFSLPRSDGVDDQSHIKEESYCKANQSSVFYQLLWAAVIYCAVCTVQGCEQNQDQCTATKMHCSPVKQWLVMVPSSPYHTLLYLPHHTFPCYFIIGL